MVYEKFQFLSADGKTKIHAIKWLPDTREYTGIIQIIHGMHEYIEKYTEFAGFLTDRGFMVVGHDNLGHGESVSAPTEYGFFTEENPSDTLVQDLHTMKTLIQSENIDIPYFMLGHSMGSFILRKYITLYNKALDGVILVGTGTMEEGTLKLGMQLCSLIAKVRGWHHKSHMVNSLSHLGAYQQYDLTGKEIEKNYLTKDLQLAEKHYKDPKCSFEFTINGYYGLLEAIHYNLQPEPIAKVPKELPIFIVSGDQDPVGDMGNGVKKVYEQYREAGILDVTCKLYKNDRHEVLNEVDRVDVYEEIYGWMCAHKNL